MKVPKHIAIILDGNRRYAKKLMLKPFNGHEFGAKKVEALFDWCKELGIKEITLYAFSWQNRNRPKLEYYFLINLFMKEFTRMFNDKRIDEDKVKINFIGRTWIFPKELQNIMQKLTDKTKDYNNFTVNFAMAYGGREEVIDAIKKLGEEIKNKDINIDDINEEVFAKNLYTDHEPELIIRTGGEKRTSNFLIWQSWYSEWIFLEKTFPEFEKQDLINAIENYSKRERRFGK
tara:strand:- start:53278 stop:53973 length:696 start_codon:yes stop_codon:yes gene_type:complete